MVEDDVAFVVHGEFRVPLEGEDVVTDAESLVTAEITGSEGRRAFRQSHHLVVVVDDEAQTAIGEIGAQLLVQDLRFAGAHAPAAGKALHTSAQRLRDELVPETDADKGNFQRCYLPNPILQAENPRRIVVSGVVGTRDEVELIRSGMIRQFTIQRAENLKGNVLIHRMKQFHKHGFVARDVLRQQTGERVAEQDVYFLNCHLGHLTVF